MKENESKHNLIYWDNDEYVGFGAGAHGYVNSTTLFKPWTAKKIYGNNRSR